MIITIDGPTASGKTTASIKLAQKLDAYCINSGLLYRILAHVLIYNYQLSLEELPILDRAPLENALSHINIAYGSDKSHMIITVNGIKITTIELKTSQLDKAASLIGINKQARELLTQLQRQLAYLYNPIVVEGRDAGTVVFPHAHVKIFLTADPYVRAVRWFNDQKKINNNFSLSEAIEFVNERDKRDQQRSISPLKSALDAIIIDNSKDQTSDDTIKKFMNYIKK